MRLAPPEGGVFQRQRFHLFEPLILFLLVANVGADRLLVPPDRVDEETSGPKVLSDEIAFALSINPSHVDRALALDVPDDLRHRMFRRDRQQHVHVIGHQVPFFDLRLLLERKPAENLAQMTP